MRGFAVKGVIDVEPRDLPAPTIAMLASDLMLSVSAHQQP